MLKECWDPLFLEAKLVVHLDLKWAEIEVLCPLGGGVQLIGLF
jgi:hypothetical protein